MANLNTDGTTTATGIMWSQYPDQIITEDRTKKSKPENIKPKHLGRKAPVMRSRHSPMHSKSAICFRPCRGATQRHAER